MLNKSIMPCSKLKKNYALSPRTYSELRSCGSLVTSMLYYRPSDHEFHFAPGQNLKNKCNQPLLLGQITLHLVSGKRTYESEGASVILIIYSPSASWYIKLWVRKSYAQYSEGMNRLLYLFFTTELECCLLILAFFSQYNINGLV